MKHLFDEDLVSSLCAVEGEAMRKQFLDDKGLNVQSARTQGPNVIYGAFGVNRYFVTDDQEVVFSVSHGSKDSAKRAKEAGFRLWDFGII